jgi:hypothetical protein
MLILVSAGAVVGQDVAAPPAPPTVWNRLGFPEGFRKLRGNLTNRNGNRPGREPKVPLKALNHPANLAEGMPPVIQEAAKVKIQEDLAPQKIKAIKYLTSIGCACYDKTGKITQALIESSEDCTEDVRLATVEAIGNAASGQCCGNCGTKCCCKPEMTMQLAKIAYDRDDKGCYIEPSKRVRDAARQALFACCPNTEPVTEIIPEPEPTPEKRPTPESGDDSDETRPQVEGSATETSSDADDEETEDEGADDEPADDDGPLPLPKQAAVVRPVTSQRMARVPDAELQAQLRERNALYAVVVNVDASLRIAHVHFTGSDAPIPSGTRLMAVVERPDGRYWLGPFQVYESFGDSSNVTAAASVDFHALTVGTPMVASLEGINTQTVSTTQDQQDQLAPVVPAQPMVHPATAPIRRVSATTPVPTIQFDETSR